MKTAPLVAILTLLTASPSWAQDEGGYALVTNTWTNDCDDVEPTYMTFDEAMTLPREQIPECVAIEGLWSSRALHRDIAARYAPSSRRERSALYFGIYQPPDTSQPETPTPARLIGKVGDCDDIGSDIWMGGFCHYGPGRILILGRSEVLAATPERWTGTEARTRIGELIEPTPEWPDRAYVEAMAAEWLGFVKARDASGYAARFHADWIRLDLAAELENPDSVFHALFVSETSIFAQLRHEKSPTLRVWLTAQQNPQPGELGAMACYSLGDWTEDRWPVSSRDAENTPGRPYVCLGITREIKDAGGFYESVDEWPFPLALTEPVW